MSPAGWGRTRSCVCHQRSQAPREITPSSSSQVEAMHKMGARKVANVIDAKGEGGEGEGENEGEAEGVATRKWSRGRRAAIAQH